MNKNQGTINFLVIKGITDTGDDIIKMSEIVRKVTEIVATSNCKSDSELTDLVTKLSTKLEDYANVLIERSRYYDSLKDNIH